MCIAIWKDQDKIITKATLSQCFNSNPDGAGFMYHEGDKLHIQKGFFEFDKFYKEYKKHELKQCVIHFRIKTHGSISVDNCHPFSITENLGFVHNGIISGYGEADVSDTRDFNHKILQELVNKWGEESLFEPSIQTLIEAKIGYSKLIFLDNLGNAEIFNENKGIWDDDVWYSNSSYKPYIPPPAPVQSYSTTGKTYAPDYPLPYYSKPKPVSKAFLQEGQLVELLAAHWDLSTKTLHNKGGVFEIISVNSDYTVDMISDDDGPGNAAFLYNVPYNKLEYYDEDLNNVFDSSTSYNPYQKELL